MSTLEHIRELIGRCEEVRREFERMRPDVFRATAGIGPVLTANIHALKTLDIPTTLQQAPILEQLREAEIGAYEDTLRLWLKLRGQRDTVHVVTPEGERIDSGVIVTPEPLTRPGTEYLGTIIDEWEGEQPKEFRMYTRDGRTVFKVYDGGKKS